MQKTNVKGFYKTQEGYLINRDTDALNEYKAKKKKDFKINNIEEKMKNLESDIAEIKALLKGLVK